MIGRHTVLGACHISAVGACWCQLRLEFKVVHPGLGRESKIAQIA
jgi:hypothetical protein